MYQPSVLNPESFRPRLEEMIHDGTLVDFMRERFLTPPLNISDRDEMAGDIFGYFTGRGYDPVKTYKEEIDGAARTLLQELNDDEELAKTGYYVNGLAFFPLRGRDLKDPKFNEVALDLLLTKGRPVVNEPYFDHEGERSLFHLFMNSYDDDKFPEDKREDTLRLLSGYIVQDHGDTLALLAGHSLSRADYDECVKLLPQVMDKIENPGHFTLAWSLVQKTEPSVLAEDLWTNLDEEHIQYFIRALRSSSGDFKDDRSKEFLREITKRTTQ